ncbi:MAG: hypothetical protein M1816_004889 [Peltula sp. TS41687]|nr:MAG: hypothetical protein M1816_004889 [Peltula sp. TS41687]
MSIQTPWTISDRPPGVNGEAIPEKESHHDRSFTAFEQRMSQVTENTKRKAEALKRKKKVDRFQKQQVWCRQMKRTQRYLGLRPRKADLPDWEPGTSTTRHLCDVTQPAPYPFDYSVVFICVDVEAYEKDNSLITEIGISTLDTLDLLSLPPGDGGSAWMKKMRCRHFRVQEYADLRNHVHVRGCPDKFDFGKSEWISKKDAKDVLTGCFSPPFSGPADAEEQSAQDGAAARRRFVLVGHSVQDDLTYLSKLGFDPRTVPGFLEVVDTGSLWRAFKREPVHRTLEITLYQLGLTGWHLHNAGNDAAYTLQAMIALAVRDLGSRDTIREDREARIQAAIMEAEERIREDGEGWSTTEENDDGGYVEIHWLPHIVPANKKEAVQPSAPQQSAMQPQPARENRALVPNLGNKPLSDTKPEPPRNLGSQNRLFHKTSQSSVASTVYSNESGSGPERGRGRGRGDQFRGNRGRGRGRARGYDQGPGRGRGGDRNNVEARSGPSDGSWW